MSDIREALDQLERRLSDLKHELGQIADESYPEPLGQALPRPPAPRQEPSTYRALDAEEIPASDPRFAPQPMPSAPHQSYPQAESAPSLAAAGRAAGIGTGATAPPGAESDYANRPRARIGTPYETAGLTQAEAARVLSDAYERVHELAGQIEQLLGIREQFLRSARDLLRQYEQRLSQLELSYRAAPAYPEVRPVGLSYAAAPAPSGFEAPSAPVREVAPAPRKATSQPTVFEGAVTIIVPWVTRLQTIQVLEDSLSRVRGAQFAYVRGYHEGEVRLELVLGEPVDLIAELGRVMPYEFSVESARQDEVVIRLDRGGGDAGEGISS